MPEVGRKRLPCEHDHDDDFQPPAPSFEDILTAAIADVGTLRYFTRPARRSRLQKQKPGPKPKVVRLKFYLLPDGCELPKFSKQDAAIERHQAIGYGFPPAYYHDGKGKAHPFSVDLAEADFKENIRSLYARLTGKDFSLFTNTQSRNLVAAPFSPTYFKTLKYQGTVVIKIQDHPQENTDNEQLVALPAVIRPVVLRPAPAAIQPVVTTPAPTVQPTMTTSHATPVQQQIVSHPQPVTHPTSTPQSSTLPQTTTTPQPAAWIPTGTPVIDINPRHRLIMEQEFDFAVSLAADQDREAARQTARVRRNLARTERQRLRDQRKEEQKTMQTNAVEEIANSRHNTAPEDMLSVILVLPDQQELNRTFSKDTLSETLHLYIEGVTDVVMAKLVYCGQVIPRRRETLSALGITGNCRIIIEEADFEDSSDERESEEEQSPEPKQLLHITDISDLERRQSRVFDSLLPAVDITVDRDNIVDDVLTLYRSKPDIIHHRLNVTFEGEEAALDVDGLTREMFSCFFLAMFLKMFSGRTHKLPMVDTRTLFNDTLVIVGKIISHAYVLCNYLPPALSPVVYVLASSGCCSDDLILSSFMSYIPETDQQLVNSLLLYKTIYC
ncbi:uncharacterized protein LOC127866097 isoform X5 [Dreissena polymorpha]|uniref:uncharacterized protein LOC127866097 isoform X5 n=1 Tax=Dreissena polymorpha TaxID=45954 RepID=UPI002264665B|nr:uncharacterized protein LOC127866097 isoform X5 [Dreissena polymorpha]